MSNKILPFSTPVSTHSIKHNNLWLIQQHPFPCGLKKKLQNLLGKSCWQFVEVNNCQDKNNNNKNKSETYQFSWLSSSFFFYLPAIVPPRLRKGVVHSSCAALAHYVGCQQGSVRQPSSSCGGSNSNRKAVQCFPSLFKTLNLITQLQHLHIKIALVS